MSEQPEPSKPLEFKQWKIAAIEEDAFMSEVSRQRVYCPVEGCAWTAPLRRDRLPEHFAKRHPDIIFHVGSQEKGKKEKAAANTKTVDNYFSKRQRVEDTPSGSLIINAVGAGTSGLIQPSDISAVGASSTPRPLPLQLSSAMPSTSGLFFA